VVPWFIFLAYDVILYLFRTITYEIPFIGGRARGKERPRAPTLKERPSGDPRVMGIGVPAATYLEQDDIEYERRHAGEQHPPPSGAYGQEFAQESESEQIHIPPELVTSNEQVRISTGVSKAAIPHPETIRDVGFAQDDSGEEENDSERPQRISSIGGADERASGTEVNARRRMGYKDVDDPS
jgi:hypothetical protein